MRFLQSASIALMLIGALAAAHAEGVVAVADDFYETVSDSLGQGTNHITIRPGETVLWRWIGMHGHTVTSDTLINGIPLFDSGVLNQGSTFSHTFKDPGTYDYECLIHQGMVGTVFVQGASAVPEPGALAFLVSGAVALLFALRRRRP